MTVDIYGGSIHGWSRCSGFSPFPLWESSRSRPAGSSPYPTSAQSTYLNCKFDLNTTYVDHNSGTFLSPHWRTVEDLMPGVDRAIPLIALRRFSDVLLVNILPSADTSDIVLVSLLLMCAPMRNHWSTANSRPRGWVTARSPPCHGTSQIQVCGQYLRLICTYRTCAV